MRDKIGSFTSRWDCERFLNRWISNYVSADDNASQATKAQFPLRDARIDVAEVVGKRPEFTARWCFCAPIFQSKRTDGISALGRRSTAVCKKVSRE